MAENPKAKQVLLRLEVLKGRRTNWETHWQDVADVFIPRKNDITFKRFPGEKRNQKVFDSTGPQALETLAAALHGLMTNPAVPFFELTTGDEKLDSRDDIRLWLQETTRKMHTILNRSNFQREIHEVYIDLCGFGTAPLIIEEDDRDMVRFSSRPISEVYIDENNLGVVDEVYREFEWDSKRVLQEFGENNVPDSVKRDFQRSEQRGGSSSISNRGGFHIVHAVRPREAFDNLTPQSMRFESIWVLKEESAILRESGFREFPYAVPRWTKMSGETYGRSPAMKTLPDVQMINLMEKTIIEGAQKTIDPPLMLPDDGFILPIKVVPGGLNYFRAGTADRIETFANDARIDFGFQAMEAIRQRIREGFFIDQLQLVQGPQMTATEVLQRTEEKMRLLGPMLGRLNSELLRPMIDRLFEIMLRRDQIPKPVPDAIQGRDVDVQFSSLIAKAQRTSETQNVLRALEFIQPFAAADPTVFDNLDGNKALRFGWKIFGSPQEILRNEDDVEAIREGRANAQAQAAQAEAEAQTAENISKAGPALVKLNQAQGAEV